jgi:hypothetical protein
MGRVTGCFRLIGHSGLSSETQIELSVDLMRKSSNERQCEEHEERITKKKIQASERWLRVVLQAEDIAEGEFKRHP